MPDTVQVCRQYCVTIRDISNDQDAHGGPAQWTFRACFCGEGDDSTGAITSVQIQVTDWMRSIAAGFSAIVITGLPTGRWPGSTVDPCPDCVGGGDDNYVTDLDVNMEACLVSEECVTTTIDGDSHCWMILDSDGNPVYFYGTYIEAIANFITTGGGTFDATIVADGLCRACYCIEEPDDDTACSEFVFGTAEDAAARATELSTSYRPSNDDDATTAGGNPCTTGPSDVYGIWFCDTGETKGIQFISGGIGNCESHTLASKPCDVCGFKGIRSVTATLTGCNFQGGDGTYTLDIAGSGFNGCDFTLVFDADGNAYPGSYFSGHGVGVYGLIATLSAIFVGGHDQLVWSSTLTWVNADGRTCGAGTPVNLINDYPVDGDGNPICTNVDGSFDLTVGPGVSAFCDGCEVSLSE